MGMFAMRAVEISSRHCRAICEEIGEGLRRHIDRTQTAPSQRIMMLLRELELRETQMPSIAPSLEDIIAPLIEEFTSSSA